ncbi:MAG TPA: energy transducer TonB [Rhizomicrobium sp.]|nr:energy transducer TonB [Rhizomicrobium sp.]
MIVRGVAVALTSLFLIRSAAAEPPPCSSPDISRPTGTNEHRADNYPILSIVLGEEGTAMVSFVIGADGRTGAPVIDQSSGSLRLDDASKEAVRSWTYSPPMSAGVPTACVQRVQVNWVIPESDAFKTLKIELAKHGFKTK